MNEHDPWIAWLRQTEADRQWFLKNHTIEDALTIPHALAFMMESYDRLIGYEHVHATI